MYDIAIMELFQVRVKINIELNTIFLNLNPNLTIDINTR